MGGAGEPITGRECLNNVRAIHDKINSFKEFFNDRFDNLENNDLAHVRGDINELRLEVRRIGKWIVALAVAVFGSSVLNGVFP